MTSLMQIDHNVPQNLYRSVLKNEHAKKVKAIFEAARLREERERIILQQKENEQNYADILSQEQKARSVQMAWDKYNRQRLLERKRKLQEELDCLEKEVLRRERKGINS